MRPAPGRFDAPRPGGPAATTTPTRPPDDLPGTPTQRLLLLFLGFCALLVFASIAIYGNLDPSTWGNMYYVEGEAIMPTWALLLYDTLFWFFVPCALSVLLAAQLRERAGPALRIGIPALVALLVFAGLVAGPETFRFVWQLVLLWLFPVWATLAIVGTGRFRWTNAQQFGATLVMIAAWRPIYHSFPDFTQVFRARGVLAPYPLDYLYDVFWLKLLRDVGFVLIGLYLLYGRFPFVQKRPEWRRDFGRTWSKLQGGRATPVWIALGMGAFAFIASLFADVLFRNLLLQAAPIFRTGTDETNLFANITPLAVLLLSLVAGIGEELIFRGILQHYFHQLFLRAWPRAGPFAFLAALVLQAMLFGLVHAGYGNLLHVFGPFMFGLFMGVVMRYFGFVAAMYAHVAIDVLAFGVSATDRHPWMESGLTYFFWANVFVGGVTAVYVALDRVFFRPRQGPEPAEARQEGV